MSVAGLIVGLGNPGPHYERTRHNLGFMLAEALVEARNGAPERSGRFDALLWKIRLPGPDRSPESWLVVEPQTFMNVSGDAVQPLSAWHRVLPERILVIHDDLDLAPGRMKFKRGGGDAGHNGLKSITCRLGTPDYYRLRLGIGRSPFGGEVTNWVLGKLTPEELSRFRNLVPAALEVVGLFARGEMTAATRGANGYVAEKV